MKNNTEAIWETIAEMLNRLDRSNVGIRSKRKNQRNAEGKVRSETGLGQHLS